MPLNSKLLRIACLLSLLAVIRQIPISAGDKYSPSATIVDAAPASASVARDVEKRDASLAEIVDAVEAGRPALRRYCDLPHEIIFGMDRSGSESRATDAEPASARATAPGDPLRELAGAARPVLEARAYARSVLGNENFDEDRLFKIMEGALTLEEVRPALRSEAAVLVLDAYREAGALRTLRAEILEAMQRDYRRGNANPGHRLAWSMIRVGASSPETQIDPDSFAYSPERAAMSLVHRGVPMRLEMDGGDYRDRVVASAYGYRFRAGWAVLFQKPLGWMAETALALKRSGVDPEIHPEWEVMEGPEGVLAIAPSGLSTSGAVFFRERLYEPTPLPQLADAGRMAEEFRRAAKTLHLGVAGDERIANPLRQALAPILMGTYLPIDPRDYFDAAFCRRLVEADYLERHIDPLPPERARELAAYRAALAKMEAGYDEFAVELGGGATLFAVVKPNFANDPSAGVERDPETGETLPRYSWRLESDAETVFFCPLPARQLYAFSLAERFAGRHRTRPPGIPDRVEVWHPIAGRLLSHEKGAALAEGAAEDWLGAVVLDARGRTDPNVGPLGWNFSPHVIVRDDQGDPVLLATPRGVVPSPDFGGMADEAKRRAAEDAWLDAAADVLRTPGELNLIYTQFFRYCSDSPLPELPNLIGSHYGLSDTHQTVYQSMERRWVGRLIGDCDDLAEFFQVLTARQGKLGHVMQLPAHAAAGYAEPAEEGGWQFVVLQTGPVLRFVGDTLEAVVEKAYRHFDDDGGKSRFTLAAVPLLLRFADEETRTPFVLSSRIYGDREYAEAMIRVQGYWHLHVFSAAIAEMEAMLATDREIGSVKELASLYNRVGRIEDSVVLRREELDAARGDAAATISTLLDIAQMHVLDKSKPLALEALGEIEALLRERSTPDNREEYGRLLPFRAYWAMLLARLDEPARAWDLLRLDVEAARERGGRLGETIFRTLVVLYDRLAREAGGDPAVRDAVAREIEAAVAAGFFKEDDSYNNILRRYFVYGRYAVAGEGRAAGLARLLADGPYPAGPKKHARKDGAVTDEDWEWFRIVPQLPLRYGLEMIDRDDHPDLYDPEAARPLLRAVGRAVEKGAGLGSDVVGGEDLVRSRLVLAFLDKDLDAYRDVMTRVRERDYANLYDDAALVFGEHCGLVPVADFPAWVEAFHRFFPGRQHYFKAAYLALDKEHFDHALVLARATAGFFPEDRLLVDEAAFLERAIPALRERAASRRAAGADAVGQ